MTDVQAQLATALAGRYRIERELGRGGMATVYLAEDLKHGRRVALKVLHPDLAHSLGADRFLREIATTAQLSHPNILPLLDSGEANGLLFYAMPYVEGETLRVRLARERQLPLEDALQVAREVADALSYAHARDVIHRDIKPENILLQSGHAVVADFGIARAVTAAGARLTETGLVVGTPAYMSPEQAAGDEAIDARSDLYALGCVLYEMLGGETPYTGPTPQAILAKKLSEAPTRLSVVRDSVPAGVEAAVSRALARTPADRFATAQQFAAALQAPYLTSGPAAVPRGRRIRPLVPVAIVGVLAAVGLAAWPLLFGRGAPRIASLAVLPPQDFSGDTAQSFFALGIHDGLISELDLLGVLRIISRTSMMGYAGTSKPVPQIARELDVDALLESSVRRAGDSIHVSVRLVQARPQEQTVWSGRYDKHVRDVLKLYGEVARDVARETDATLTGAQTTRLASIRQVNPATYEAYVKAMYYLDQGTQAGAERGLVYLREAIDRDPGDPLAWATLAVGYITAAHGPAPPLDALPLARAAADRALRLDSSLSETMAALAFLRGYYDWEWEEGERLFLRALEVNPSSAMSHYWYSWQLVLFGHLDSAIAEHIRAREADPLNPLHTAWLGELYAYQGRYEQALEEAQRAIDLMPGFPVSYYVISNVRSTQGRHEEAIAAARQAVAADPEWKWVLGVALARAGREAEARRILAELQAARTTPWVAFSLAVVHAALGDKDDAFRWLNYEHPHAWVPWVRIGPWFSRLWDDPRLPQLLEKMNLPPRRPPAAAPADR